MGRRPISSDEKTMDGECRASMAGVRTCFSGERWKTQLAPLPDGRGSERLTDRACQQAAFGTRLSMKTVGILALQGDFEAHRKAIERAGARAVEVRTVAQMHACDGLIIPGGESTAMLKLLEIENLLEPLREFGRNKPVYGTCAGAILIAHEVSHPSQTCLDLMDISVERNGYGRQIDSHIAALTMEAGAQSAEGTDLEAVFIRAPIIRRVGGGARVLARHQGDPVWVEQGRHMVTTFHPELTQDVRVHRRFVERL